VKRRCNGNIMSEVATIVGLALSTHTPPLSALFTLLC